MDPMEPDRSIRVLPVGRSIHVLPGCTGCTRTSSTSGSQRYRYRVCNVSAAPPPSLAASSMAATFVPNEAASLVQFHAGFPRLVAMAPAAGTLDAARQEVARRAVADSRAASAAETTPMPMGK
jgi:hypothetical protein